eukprot:TRINITY_DN11988_c0_g1_i2.p3 TRINITY_DN11988_c0_g1~~TRINITY_DN11988_c0_g1_i2.p3  ORF type:complete len:134 (+),score=32.07 TRINITY_DN11988_c0_g1_i2:337-738(+)
MMTPAAAAAVARGILPWVLGQGRAWGRAQRPGLALVEGLEGIQRAAVEDTPGLSAVGQEGSPGRQEPNGGQELEIRWEGSPWRVASQGPLAEVQEGTRWRLVAAALPVAALVRAVLVVPEDTHMAVLLSLIHI